MGCPHPRRIVTPGGLPPVAQLCRGRGGRAAPGLGWHSSATRYVLRRPIPCAAGPSASPRAALWASTSETGSERPPALEVVVDRPQRGRAGRNPAARHVTSSCAHAGQMQRRSARGSGSDTQRSEAAWTQGFRADRREGGRPGCVVPRRMTSPYLRCRNTADGDVKGSRPSDDHFKPIQLASPNEIATSRHCDVHFADLMPDMKAVDCTPTSAHVTQEVMLERP